MACLWVVAPEGADHVFRASVGFAPWGVNESSGTETVSLLPDMWPEWLRTRAEEEGVHVPVKWAKKFVGGIKGSVSCQLLGLMKLTHHDAGYFAGPVTRWNDEGT